MCKPNAATAVTHGVDTAHTHCSCCSIAVCMLSFSYHVACVTLFTWRLHAFIVNRFDPEVKKKPRRLPVGLFSWIRPVLLYPEEEITTVSGLDVVVFLRLLKYGEHIHHQTYAK